MKSLDNLRLERFVFHTYTLDVGVFKCCGAPPNTINFIYHHHQHIIDDCLGTRRTTARLIQEARRCDRQHGRRWMVWHVPSSRAIRDRGRFGCLLFARGLPQRACSIMVLRPPPKRDDVRSNRTLPITDTPGVEGMQTKNISITSCRTCPHLKYTESDWYCERAKISKYVFKQITDVDIIQEWCDLPNVDRS